LNCQNKALIKIFYNASKQTEKTNPTIFGGQLGQILIRQAHEWFSSVSPFLLGREPHSGEDMVIAANRLPDRSTTTLGGTIVPA
jgi:hypothetical protein